MCLNLHLLPARQSRSRAPLPSTLSIAARDFVPGAKTHKCRIRRTPFTCGNKCAGCRMKWRHKAAKCVLRRLGADEHKGGGVKGWKGQDTRERV
jgi:hypothetical protein